MRFTECASGTHDAAPGKKMVRHMLHLVPSAAPGTQVGTETLHSTLDAWVPMWIRHYTKNDDAYFSFSSQIVLIILSFYIEEAPYDLFLQDNSQMYQITYHKAT